MNPEEIAKWLHEALDGFRFSFDAEAKTNGYDAALGRLNAAKRRARQALKTVDEWANESNGAMLIARERSRQVKEEGFDDDHDARWNNRQLALAGYCYLARYLGRSNPAIETLVPNDWPFDSERWKPSDNVRTLVKAGALIAAEIDRLSDRDYIIIKTTDGKHSMKLHIKPGDLPVEDGDTRE